MGIAIGIVVVIVLGLAISQACEWIGSKTAYTLWAVIGTALTGLLIQGWIHASTQSVEPHTQSVCQRLDVC